MICDGKSAQNYGNDNAAGDDHQNESTSTLVHNCISKKKNDNGNENEYNNRNANNREENEGNQGRKDKTNDNDDKCKKTDQKANGDKNGHGVGNGK